MESQGLPRDNRTRKKNPRLRPNPPLRAASERRRQAQDRTARASGIAFLEDSFLSSTSGSSGGPAAVSVRKRIGGGLPPRPARKQQQRTLEARKSDESRIATVPETQDSESDGSATEKIYGKHVGTFFNHVHSFGDWSRQRSGSDSVRPTTPHRQYIEKCEKLGLVPEPLLARRSAKRSLSRSPSGNLIQDNLSDQGVLSLHGFGLGDSMLIALAGSVALTPGLRVLDLSGNRATDASLRPLLSELCSALSACLLLEQLDLSRNKLGRGSMQQLSHFVASAAALRTISMEECSVNDAGFRVLDKAFCNARGGSLTSLNLARNKLTDAAADSLARMMSCKDIPQGEGLQVLDLSWNRIGWRGGLRLSAALEAQDPNGRFPTLHSLDLSWNSLGSKLDRKRSCCMGLSNCLAVNTNLTHLDISHNHFTAEDCSVLAAALRSNHTLMGLHVAGDMSLNARGFAAALNPSGQDWTEASGATSHIFTRILRPRVRGREAWAPVSNCWICEKWTEKRFVCHGVSEPQGGEDPPKVMLCASFDKWAPQLMAKAESKEEPGAHEIFRMVPPGDSHYFFLLEGKSFTTPGQAIVPSTSLLLPPVLPQTEDVPQNSVPEMIHHLMAEENREETEILVQPRTEDAVSPTRKPAKEPWKFEDSLFTTYDQDTESLLDKAFARDYSYTKIPAMAALKNAPEEEENVRTVLREHFAVIKDIFKHYAAAYSSEIFNLGANGCNEVLSVCQILEEKTPCNRTEADMLFISSNLSGPRDQRLNPRRALCRYQFMEMMTSLALTKFFKSGAEPTPSAAVKRYIQVHLQAAERDLGQAFRKAFLYTEDIDTVLREFLPALTAVYGRFSGKENGPTERRTMSIGEWQRLLETTGIMDGVVFGDRPCRLCYVRAMQTSVDELADKYAHRKMEPVEFYEAIVRVAMSRLEHEAAASAALAAASGSGSMSRSSTPQGGGAREAAGSHPGESGEDSIHLAPAPHASCEDRQTGDKEQGPTESDDVGCSQGPPSHPASDKNSLAPISRGSSRGGSTARSGPGSGTGNTPRQPNLSVKQLASQLQNTLNLLAPQARS